LQKGSGTPSTFIFIYSYQNKNPPKQVQAVNQHLMPHSINKKKTIPYGWGGWLDTVSVGSATARIQQLVAAVLWGANKIRTVTIDISQYRLLFGFSCGPCSVWIAWQRSSPMKGELRWRGLNGIYKFDHHNIYGGAVSTIHDDIGRRLVSSIYSWDIYDCDAEQNFNKKFALCFNVVDFCTAVKKVLFTKKKSVIEKVLKVYTILHHCQCGTVYSIYCMYSATFYRIMTPLQMTYVNLLLNLCISSLTKSD
jgi:hypothetical protein